MPKSFMQCHFFIFLIPMEIKKILVATDFSKVAHNALVHALKVAETTRAVIHVLHVVKSEKEVDQAMSKIENQIAAAKSSFKMVPEVRIGNFLGEIGKTASELDVQFIFMGTHGVKGFKQTVTGADAMKVVTHSAKPFIVVQERPIGAQGYDSIVVPLDMSEDSKQKLDEVADLAKYFNSKIHIFARKESNPSLSSKLRNNILFAKKYYAQAGIGLDITVSESSKSFDKELIEFSKSIDADLIAIVNSLKWNLFGGVFSARREESIVTNKEGIPVLCVNPVELKTSSYSM